MARTRQCRLCGADVKVTVAAHVCPHENPCRYLCGTDGLPIDWASPECDDCRAGTTSIAKQLMLIREDDVEEWPDD
jgi:hypothetical protein